MSSLDLFFESSQFVLHNLNDLGLLLAESVDLFFQIGGNSDVGSVIRDLPLEEWGEERLEKLLQKDNEGADDLPMGGQVDVVDVVAGAEGGQIGRHPAIGP